MANLSKPPAGALPEPAAASARRRNLLIGGGLAIVLLAVGGYLMLGSGGSSSSSVPVAVVPTVAKTPTASPTPTTPTRALSAKRNPFKVLIVADTPAASAAPGATPTASAAPTTTPTIAPTTAPPATPTASPTSAGTSYILTLRTVAAGGTLTWSVDGQPVTTTGNQQFGKYNEFTIQSIVGGTVTLAKTGLASFTLTAGHSVTVL